MDGHPEVGADTLARALSLHRTTALRLFRTRVDNLARAFSHSSLRVPVSEELDESLERDAEELPSAAVLRRPHREWEPLRTKLGFVHHRLGNTLTPRGREPGYADAQALRRDIELVLAHVNSRHVALGVDPAAAVADRRLRLPPGGDRHPPGRRASCARRRARSCPATPTPTSRAARRC